MAVKAIERGIDRAAEEPLGKWKIPLQHLAEGFEPRQFARAFGPKALGILLGTTVKRLVFGETSDFCRTAEFRSGRERAALAQYRFNVVTVVVSVGHVLNPPACFARLETQIQCGGIADLAAVGTDLPQPLEQLRLDTGRELGSDLDRARGPSQHNAPLRAAEIIKEPRATGERSMRRPLHLKQTHQALAAGFGVHTMAGEKLLVHRGVRIDGKADRLGQ